MEGTQPVDKLAQLEALTTPEAIKYLSSVGYDIGDNLRQSIEFCKNPDTPEFIIDAVFDKHSAETTAWSYEQKRKVKEEDLLHEKVCDKLDHTAENLKDIAPEIYEVLEKPDSLDNIMDLIFRWSRRSERYELRSEHIGTVMWIVKTKFVDEIAQELKPKPKKAIPTKKTSGRRRSKGENTEVYVVGDREALEEQYQLVADKQAIGWFCKEDRDIVFEQYDKLFNIGEKDPRNPHLTLTVPLERRRLRNCIRKSPFSQKLENGCAGAVKWKEGMNGSKYCRDKDINNSVMVMCSKAKSSTNPTAAKRGFCDTCFKKKDWITFDKGESKKTGGGAYVFNRYFTEDEVICGIC